MEAPREEAGTWNEAFEFGKVLVFANTSERALLRPIREVLQRNDAMYYIVDQRLEPRAVHQALLHRARRNEDGENGNPRERQQPEAETSEASKEN
jgi:hypothetical protein